MKARLSLLPICAVLLTFGAAAPAAAQFLVGAHVSQMNEAFNGAIGLGARAGIDPPVLPIHVVGVAEYFFPDCGPVGDCSLKGASVEANFELPLPFLDPYASVGWAWREIDPTGPDPAVTDTGLTLGLGTALGLGSLAPFFEGRYEFLDAPENQFLLRFGFFYRR